jgi:hypothetical protein
MINEVKELNKESINVIKESANAIKESIRDMKETINRSICELNDKIKELPNKKRPIIYFDSLSMLLIVDIAFLYFFIILPGIKRLF